MTMPDIPIGKVKIVNPDTGDALKPNADGSLNANTTGLATQTTLAAVKTDLDSIKTDADSLVTNTTGLATSANQTTGNTNTGNIATATGGIADAAYTSGSGSAIAILKGIFGRLGATLGFDNTNVLKVSQYVKTSVAGDTALTLGQGTKATSLPVTLPSDQGALAANATLQAGSNLAGGFQLVDSAGTNKAAIDAAGNQAVKTGFSEQASLSAGSLNADLLASMDVSGYRWVSLQVGGTWTGTLSFQGSNDNSIFYNVFLNNSASYAGIGQSTLSNGLYSGPVRFHYLRIRMTSYTSGTATGTLDLSTLSSIENVMATTIENSSITVQPGNTQNTTAWLVNLPGSDITVFASGAQTATQIQADQTNNIARGIKAVLDMTNVTSSPSVTLEIDGKDVASGKYYPILTGAAVTTQSTNVYTIYPSVPAVANVSATDCLPHTWRIKVTANNTNSGTYSVGASLLP